MESARNSPIRLILHMGAGKTGSTSIQQTLKHAQETLKRNGFWYLGLMLENAHEAKYSWQRETTTNFDFNRLGKEAGSKQLVSVLVPTLEAARAHGIHTLIWSNESFFDVNDAILDGLSHLQNELINVELVVYIRRHDSWARSAYLQWGIKHKTYKGGLRPFHEWVRYALPKFSERLEAIAEKRVGSLNIRNYDHNKDVVNDFIAVCGLEGAKLEHRRANDTPDAAELLLRALFNEQFSEAVLPNVFDGAVGMGLLRGGSTEKFLESLLPTDSDLRNVRDACSGDREKVNLLLAGNGQPPIAVEPLPETRFEIDARALMLAVSRVLVSQAEKIRRLEGELDRIAGELKRDRSV